MTRKRKYKIAMKIAIILIIIFLLIINGIGLYIGNKFYNEVITINVHREMNTYEVFKSTFNFKRLNSLEKEEDVTIPSNFGYELSGTYIKNPAQTNNTVIIAHGITGSRWQSMKYADIYLDLGFNVLVYDSRSHGKSGGSDITLGYFEKYDLNNVVSYVKRLNPGGIIGVHGESMGAATALLHSKMNEDKKDVKFYVVDCPFSDLSELISMKLEDMLKSKNTTVSKTLVFYANAVVKLKANFSLYAVSPINAIKDVETPILFIHGEEDSVIPPSMSMDLYNAKKGEKDIYIAPNAGHVESYLKNKKEYSKRVKGFLEGLGIIRRLDSEANIIQGERL